MVERKQRIEFCDLAKLAPEAKEQAERATVNGQIINIFKVLMNHPKLTRAWGRFGGYIMGPQTMAPRERELAILRIGWLNQAPYEWEQHVRIGKTVGIA